MFLVCSVYFHGTKLCFAWQKSVFYTSDSLRNFSFPWQNPDCLTQNDSKTEKLQFYFALLCSLDDNSVCVGEMNTEDIAKTEFHETQVSFP